MNKNHFISSLKDSTPEVSWKKIGVHKKRGHKHETSHCLARLQEPLDCSIKTLKRKQHKKYSAA